MFGRKKANKDQETKKKGAIKKGYNAFLWTYNPTSLVKNGYHSALDKTFKPSLNAAWYPYAIMRYGILPSILSINPVRVWNAVKNSRRLNVSWHLLSIYSSIFVLVNALGLFDHYIWVMNIPVIALIIFALYGQHGEDQ